jgi:hypothetical protein
MDLSTEKILSGNSIMNTPGTVLKALAQLLRPWRTIRRLKRQNERLADALSNPLLTGIELGKERGIDVGMKGSGPQLLAGMFLGWLEQDGRNAPNYLEVTFNSPKGPILVIAMQPNGATPDELRRQAEHQVRQLQAEVLRLRTALENQ